MPAPRTGLQYELVLSRDAKRKQVVWKGVSPDGKLQASPVEPDKHFLASRLVEAATSGSDSLAVRGVLSYWIYLAGAQ